jgi:hypothetical protein
LTGRTGKMVDTFARTAMSVESGMAWRVSRVADKRKKFVTQYQSRHTAQPAEMRGLNQQPQLVM